MCRQYIDIWSDWCRTKFLLSKWIVARFICAHYLSNDYDRGDGRRGVVVATVSQPKPEAIKAGINAEPFNCFKYSEAIGHYTNVIYMIAEADELDEHLRRKVVICVKNRNGVAKRSYSIDPYLEKSIFHDPTTQHINRNKT